MRDLESSTEVIETSASSLNHNVQFNPQIESIGDQEKGHKSISILIVDEHPATRIGLSDIFKSEDDLKVVAQAGNCSESMDAVKLEDLDVIIFSVIENSIKAIRTIEAIRKKDLNVKIVLYAAVENEQYVVDAVRAGVNGYVIKTSPLNCIIEAVRSVVVGKSYLDPAIALSIMNRIESKNTESTTPKLTERETSVLKWVVEGRRNKEIARELVISERTVKYHINSIFQKLGANSRTDIVRMALQMKLVEV